ncbi:hypothetical protein EC957_011453 [Mortierella hygrophila]|uniref:Sphingomyelin phosphodiesterase n=1 Tax=Mortierella hygrophila TaxID=979708 RepID=A0A9P6FH56_9FUNG|nr:hypothetical protein EC957_011453 [Mortierella hygrophila]
MPSNDQFTRHDASCPLAIQQQHQLQKAYPAQKPILCLVIAAPAPGPNASELVKRSWLGDKIIERLQEVKNSFSCGACVTGLVTVKNITLLKRSWGIGRVEGAVLVESLLSADITGGDGKFICFHAGGLCGLPIITSGTLAFPKSKPVNATIPTPSGTLVDLARRWQYTTGSEALCNKAICCRKYANSPATVARAAPSWGDYDCDAPPKLATNMLEYVPSVANISFGIMTGTSLRTMPGSRPPMFLTLKSGGDIAWLYNTLADDWTRWLTSDAVKSFKNYGSYTLNPAPGLCIVSLNTNFCNTMNFICTVILLSTTPMLQVTEDIDERVWIIGHVPHSQVDCINNWSSLYRQVVARYSLHVIAEQFFGHSHCDDFSLTYGPGGKSAQNEVSTTSIGPSVTPYIDINPAFRVCKVDTKSWGVFESLTYVADLDKSTSWDATGSSPNWHLEYSARHTYSTYVPIAVDQPLSAGCWYNVTNVLESNPAGFNQYWSLRDHSANRLPYMRSEICSGVVVPLKKRGDDNSHDASAAGANMSPNPAASVITGIRSLGEWGPNAKPWNKKLC